MILYRCVFDTIGGKCMKKTFIFMMLMCVVLLTGCSSLVNLTEDESNMLTEYMAGVVLKHADDYEDGLLTVEEIEALEAKAEERNKRIEANSNDTKTQVTSNTSSNSKKKTSSKAKFVSLTKAVGNSNFKIQYKQYKSYDKYVSEDTTSNVTLEAGKNKKLLVFYFDVKNLSNETLKLDLVEEGIGYQLVLDNGSKVKPLLTLLMNDIQYLNLDIAANMTKEAVIVFEVDKNVELSNSTLTVTRKDMTSNIDLK
jgi:uncharacterized protein YceK